MSATTVPTATLWVCVDCMLSNVNGEEPQSPDREPWGLIGDGAEVTPGLLSEEHDTPCGSFATPGGDFLGQGCDCEERDFSWSPCQGCGSTLGGSRHAFTLWA